MHEEHIVVKFLQGFYVLFHYTVIILGLTGVLPIALLYFLYIQPLSWLLLAIYLTWLFIDWRTPKRGGRKVGVNFIGSLYPFRCMRDYYPIKLVKTADLDSKRNYIFGYHPHGFMPDGLLISFGTNLLGFEEEFPGITPHIGAHSTILQTPFYREVALWLRVVDVQLESCKYILTQMGPGNSIAITPGGAAEMLDSCRKDYILTVNRRKQFIKMALETGSSLVPVFGFGQNDSFHQPSFTNLNWLKSYKRINRSVLEKWVKLFIRGTLISLCGKFCIPCLPYNNPITVVVGSPIHVDKVTRPSDEQIEKLHAEYIEGLKRLFEENRNKYGVPRDIKLIIQ